MGESQLRRLIQESERREEAFEKTATLQESNRNLASDDNAKQLTCSENSESHEKLWLDSGIPITVHSPSSTLSTLHNL